MVRCEYNVYIMQSPIRTVSRRVAPCAAASSADQRAIAELCAALFRDPACRVVSARIPVLSPLLQPAHTHPDILQFDIASHCGGGWRTPKGLLPARGLTAVVFHPGEKHGHALTPLGRDSECLSVKIRVRRDWPVLLRHPFQSPAQVFPQQGLLWQSARRVCRWQAVGQANDPVFTSYLCEMLCLWPRRDQHDSQATVTLQGLDPTPLKRVADWLEQRWNSPPGLNEIAQVAHRSPRQITRWFVNGFGCTPKQYTDRLRLSRARALLWQEDLPIKNIAEDLGFASIHHFTRWFHRQVGQPPGRFRARGTLL